MLTDDGELVRRHHFEERCLCLVSSLPEYDGICVSGFILVRSPILSIEFEVGVLDQVEVWIRRDRSYT